MPNSPVAMSFDRLAPHYRWLERVVAGEVLQAARVAHLAALDEAGNILLVGEGPGRFLEALRVRRPDIPVTVVDTSSRMLAAARQVSIGPTTFLRQDVTQSPLPTGRWDAVVTHCFLDCFAPMSLQRVIANLAQAARPAAPWLITDFALPTTGWRRWRAQVLHAVMYRTFRLLAGLEAVQWTDPTSALHRHGFALHTRRAFNHGLINADLWVRR